jgi:nucleoside-diphosphate-sugar epimerase
MRALVTGATGFIGTHLVTRLKRLGYECRCLVRSRQRASQMKALCETEIIEGDVTDAASLSGAGKGIDHAFHLAAVGHVSAVSEDARRVFVKTNAHGAENVARVCAEEGVGRLVHFSSTAAIGLPDVPVADEATPCQPSTPYQLSKRSGELAVLRVGTEGALDVVIVRPCMVIGPGGYGEFLKMARLMARGLFPRVGRGANLTPVVHVRDVVDGAILAAERGVAGEAYLLVGGSYPMDEIRNLVVSALGRTPPYPYLPTWLALLGAAALERVATLSGRTPIVTRANISSTVADRVFSTEKARKALGFSPRVPIEEAVQETVNWYLAQGAI